MEYTNLGKKTFWWRVRLYLLAPLWLMSDSPTRKTWDEYAHGMIKHKCEWDYDHPNVELLGKSYPCKHYGCNFVSMQEKDGKWTWEK